MSHNQQETVGRRHNEEQACFWCPRVLCFQELRNAQSEQLMGIRREEEMEMSDDENCDSPTKKMRVDESGNARDCPVPKRYQHQHRILNGE